MSTSSNWSSGEASAHRPVQRDPIASREQDGDHRHAQKMAALGRLAGGIAHDFNNLLTVIKGYSQLLLKRLPSHRDMREELQQIVRASERAAALTRQLLCFCSKQAFQREVIDLNALLVEYAGTLRTLAGDSIELIAVLAPELPAVEAARGEILQILVTLIASAQEAMPQGGQLTLETSPGHFPAAHGRPPAAGSCLDDSSPPEGTAGTRLEESPALPAAGCLQQPAVLLRVRSTGRAMDEQIKAHLFEAYVTTKQNDRGTGLGLATVVDLVHHLGGELEAVHHADHGTTYSIFLPLAQSFSTASAMPAKPCHVPPASGTVLLVEDADYVRSLIERVLVTQGYQVLTAASGKEALQLAGERQQPIDLLVTDIVMPRMNGRELAIQLTLRWPNLRVLFLSGYAPNVVGAADADAIVAFLQKPFTPAVLLQKVHDLLNPPLAGLP
jgi:two-component system cell cycle sensor histidine kinase/response regulator CckA